jgi:integrase
MATIRKRNDKWQVQIRRTGNSPVSRTFRTKSDAQTWARQIEAEADRRGLPVNLRVLDKTTVADLMVRYRETVTPRKRGKVREAVALNVFLHHPLSASPLSAFTRAKAAAYRDERLRKLKPASVNREIAIYRHAFEVARKLWDIPLRSNPFAELDCPKVSNGRTRRLEPGEWERLEGACRRSRNPFVRHMVEFALETAMRRGEVLAARWVDVELTKRTMHIPQAKNGHSRTIPLTARALDILRALKSQDGEEGEIFKTTEDAVKMAWRRIMRRAGLPDFRYHDLRHEAISRFFELGLSIPEVGLISGHRDPRTLFRYTHPRAEDIARRLGGDKTCGAESRSVVQEVDRGLSERRRY